MPTVGRIRRGSVASDFVRIRRVNIVFGIEYTQKSKKLAEASFFNVAGVTRIQKRSECRNQNPVPYRSGDTRTGLHLQGQPVLNKLAGATRIRNLGMPESESGALPLWRYPSRLAFEFAEHIRHIQIVLVATIGIRTCDVAIIMSDVL